MSAAGFGDLGVTRGWAPVVAAIVLAFIPAQVLAVNVSPASLPNGAQNTTCSRTMTASAGSAPYTFAVTAGALPSGLNLASGGLLCGTPSVNGTFSFTVTATDALAVTGSRA